MKKISVLGAGTWGITLAYILSQKGYEVYVWDINVELLDYINTKHTHPRFNYLNLKNIWAEKDILAVVEKSEAIFIVVPSQAVRSVCKKIKSLKLNEKIFVICSKGIEIETGKLLSEVVKEELGNKSIHISVLSGPSHAEEVSKGLPTAITVASENDEIARKIQEIVFAKNFRVYRNNDIIGVQVGGSVKNVIAIAGGISDGMGFGDNSRAALITRGLSEMVRLGKKLGANEITFMGLAGIGDLVVTITSKHSRNRYFGELIGKGYSISEALKKVGMIVEGFFTTKSVYNLKNKLGVEMPISEVLYKVLYEGLKPHKGLEILLNREAKPEIY